MSDPRLSSVHVPNFAPRLYGIAALVTAIVLAGAWLVGRYNESDLSRDMQLWQEKLNLIAESRTADVSHWVGNNFMEVKRLADNPSLQMYMTELQLNKGKGDAPEAAEMEPAQMGYLRNLLLFTAQHAGFGTGSDDTNAAGIPADLPSQSKSGLAILDAHNQIVVSTPMSQATQDILLARAAQLPAGEQSLLDVEKDKSGAPYIGFAEPIYSIQGDRNAASQIGHVVGIKAVDGNLFDLLVHPGVTEKTLEVLLVRKGQGQLVDYISPLGDGTSALGKQADLSNPKLAVAALMKETGGFFADNLDYRGKPVLATSRNVSGTPWTLIAKVDRSEALAQSNQRRAGMEMFFFLIIAVIVLIIIVLWRHAYSKRAIFMSGYFRNLAAHSLAQEKLLRLVADNQPESIYLVDKARTVHFANQKAAMESHMSVESMPGKPFEDVRGGGYAGHIIEQCDKALQAAETGYDVQRFSHDGSEKVIRSAYVPLAHVPVSVLPEPTPGVLIVEQDISEVVLEREQRLETQKQLVNTLIKLVDKRDPFSANHSQLVAQVAQEVAIGMELDSQTIETTAIAGKLMNVGKILVPTELLTKTDSLSDEEKRIIRDSMQASSEMVHNVNFDGPVTETLRQWQEKWDGSGHLGLKGDDILLPARIIAVANAFIGMISPRSWRTAMPIDSATKFLLGQSDTYFDRRVVIALINYMENHRGKAWLKGVLEGKKDNA